MHPRWVIGAGAKSTARCRVFCFPHAGGSASFFAPWIPRASDAIEICPVELPGRGSRLGEEPFREIGPMVSALCDAVLPCLDRPYALFGSSMGALIAYELARRLADLTPRPPALVCVSGNAAPHVPMRAAALHRLPDDAFLSELRQLGGTPEEFFGNRELLALLLPMLRSDFAVCETYRHVERPPLGCPILAFGGTSDRYIPSQHIEEWSMHTASRFSCHMLPGDHFFLAQHMDEVLRMVSGQLNHVTT